MKDGAVTPTFLSKVMRCWDAVPSVHTVVGQCHEGDTKEVLLKMQRCTLSRCQLLYTSPAQSGPGDFFHLFGSEGFLFWLNSLLDDNEAIMPR